MLTTARDIVRGLGGRWIGNRSRCKCPVKPHSSGETLAITATRDGRPLVHCHAGCDQRDVIEALRSMGLWGSGELVRDPSYPAHWTVRHDEEERARSERVASYVRQIWHDANPITGTHAEAYLRARGIEVMLPDALRYTPALKHPKSKTPMPAMLAAITNEGGDVLAVQRTYLDKIAPRKADIDPNKMTVGSMGEGVVRLGPANGRMLGLAEGVETALSAAQLYSVPVWATLSAHRLTSIKLPHNIELLTIFGDAGTVGQEKAFEAAEHYERLGVHADVIFPAAHFDASCKDFNDVLTVKNVSANG